MSLTTQTLGKLSHYKCIDGVRWAVDVEHAVPGRISRGLRINSIFLVHMADLRDHKSQPNIGSPNGLVAFFMIHDIWDLSVQLIRRSMKYLEVSRAICIVYHNLRTFDVQSDSIREILHSAQSITNAIYKRLASELVIVLSFDKFDSGGFFCVDFADLAATNYIRELFIQNHIIQRGLITFTSSITQQRPQMLVAGMPTKYPTPN